MMKQKDSKIISLCLDLSPMDSILLEYTEQFISLLPSLEQIVFHHNIYFKVEDEGEWNYDTLAKGIRSDIQQKVDRFFPSHSAYEVSTIITNEQSTASAIHDVSKKNEVDVIFVGRKLHYIGRGGVVMKLARIPNKMDLLVIPDTAPISFRSFLCPVDFSEPSVDAVKQAKHLAQESQIQVELLHVYNVPVVYFPYLKTPKTDEKQRIRVSREIEGFIKKHLSSDAPTVSIVPAKNQSIARRIERFSIRNQHDMIFIGKKGKGKVQQMILGSVAHQLLQSPLATPLWLCG